jgi:hypothetical protein
VQIFGLQPGDVDIIDEEISAQFWREGVEGGHHDMAGGTTA